MTFCIPSKNNLRYVKVAIESIRKNAMRDDHYIHILVDKNDDKCYEWLMENKDENTIVKLNDRGELYGIGEATPVISGVSFHLPKTKTSLSSAFSAKTPLLIKLNTSVKIFILPLFS